MIEVAPLPISPAKIPEAYLIGKVSYGGNDPIDIRVVSPAERYLRFEASADPVPSPELSYAMLSAAAPGLRSFEMTRKTDGKTTTEVSNIAILNSMLIRINADAVGHREMVFKLYYKGHISGFGEINQYPWSGGLETVAFARVSSLPERRGILSSLIPTGRQQNDLDFYCRQLQIGDYEVSGDRSTNEARQFEESIRALRDTERWHQRYGGQEMNIEETHRRAHTYEIQLEDQKRFGGSESGDVFVATAAAG